MQLRSAIFFALMFLSSCGGVDRLTPSFEEAQPPQPAETSLPDRIRCELPASAFLLVIVVKDDALPAGVTAVGLKNAANEVFKFATQTYTTTSEPNILNFMEIPATSVSREVKLNLETKSATLLRSQIPELGEAAVFNCRF